MATWPILIPSTNWTRSKSRNWRQNLKTDRKVFWRASKGTRTWPSSKKETDSHSSPLSIRNLGKWPPFKLQEKDFTASLRINSVTPKTNSKNIHSWTLPTPQGLPEMRNLNFPLSQKLTLSPGRWPPTIAYKTEWRIAGKEKKSRGGRNFTKGMGIFKIQRKK